jgi:hypothetical protein
MNPIHWIRWKVLAGLVVIVGGAVCFGMNPLVRCGINAAGSRGLGAKWRVDGFRFGVASGRIELTGLAVSRADGEPDMSLDRGGIMAAETASLDVDMNALLRKRLYAEVRLMNPRLRIERGADGRIKLDSTPETTDGSIWDHSGDWLATLDKWFQKLHEWERRRREVADKLPPRKAGEPPTAPQRPAVNYARRVTYPFDRVPRLAATRIVGEGLVVEFVDSGKQKGRDASPPPLTDGTIVIENLSDRPDAFAEPIRWTIAGRVDGAPVRLAGTLDRRTHFESGRMVANDDLDVDFDAQSLPIALVEFLAGGDLPIRFDSGRMNLAAKLAVSDGDRIHVQPTFGFFDTVVSPRAGVKRILGLEPDLFCQAFNEVRNVEIADIRVAGTLRRPDVDLGETLVDIVKSGGKAVAKRHIDKGLEVGRTKLREAVDEQLDKLGGVKAIDELTKDLPGGLGQGIGDGLTGKQGSIRKGVEKITSARSLDELNAAAPRDVGKTVRGGLPKAQDVVNKDVVKKGVERVARQPTTDSTPPAVAPEPNESSDDGGTKKSKRKKGKDRDKVDTLNR